MLNKVKEQQNVQQGMFNNEVGSINNHTAEELLLPGWI